MERDNWKPYFEIHKFPYWICPTCNKGKLIFNENNFVRKPTAETQTFPDSYQDEVGNEIPGPDIGELEGIDFQFVCLLNCDNKKCNEYVSANGQIIQSLVSYFDEQTGHDYYITDFYYPRFIFPTINLFSLHENYSIEIKKALINAFKLLWCDNSACANKIRIVIENILDQRKIKKFVLNKKKKRIPISLHKRIELFEIQSPQIAELFYSIKWLGNEGSHKDEKIEFEDLIDAFELLENALEELFHKKKAHIKKIVKKINKKYRPKK